MGYDQFSASDLSRLLDIIATTAEESEITPSDAIRKVAEILSGKEAEQDSDCRESLAELANRVRQLRLKRNELFGAPLFKDPAWDMLLELFAAHTTGRDVTVSSLCYASGVPPTTALRYLTKLEEHGLLTREGDRHDMRRLYVRPTAKTIEGLVVTGQQLVKHVHVVSGPARS